ncbi:hypothetical protein B0H14DRAFT_2575786 [Mycena olivaceomarginata]|nr:hypothetical protein B0H14DRAFT_2575786 [Mycena olivaceomarginata]
MANNGQVKPTVGSDPVFSQVELSHERDFVRIDGDSCRVGTRPWGPKFQLSLRNQAPDEPEDAPPENDDARDSRFLSGQSGGREISSWIIIRAYPCSRNLISISHIQIEEKMIPPSCGALSHISRRPIGVAAVKSGSHADSPSTIAAKYWHLPPRGLFCHAEIENIAEHALKMAHRHFCLEAGVGARAMTIRNHSEHWQNCCNFERVHSGCQPWRNCWVHSVDDEARKSAGEQTRGKGQGQKTLIRHNDRCGEIWDRDKFRELSGFDPRYSLDVTHDMRFPEQSDPHHAVDVATYFNDRGNDIQAASVASSPPPSLAFRILKRRVCSRYRPRNQQEARIQQTVTSERPSSLALALGQIILTQQRGGNVDSP